MYIRSIKEKDYTAISIMLNGLHSLHVKNRSDIYAKTDSVISKSDFIQMIEDENCIAMIAEAGGKAAGYGVGEIKNTAENPLLMKHKSLYIQEIYVKPSYRKKSIGRDLLEKIENEGRKLGADRMDLTVWAFNKNAIKFYEYCGMEEQRIILEKKI